MRASTVGLHRFHSDKTVLTKAILDLATEYGHHARLLACDRIIAPSGLLVNHKFVECIWRYEGLKAAQK